MDKEKEKEPSMVRCSSNAMRISNRMINISYLTIVFITLGILGYLLYIFMAYFGFPTWLNIIILILLLTAFMIILLALINKRLCAKNQTDVISQT